MGNGDKPELLAISGRSSLSRTAVFFERMEPALMEVNPIDPVMEQLQAQCVRAILQAVQEFRAQNADLFGFALCTNDEVSTLFHVACTKDWVRNCSADNPDKAYISVEWTSEADRTSFRVISNQLSVLSQRDEDLPEEWEAARNRRFSLLVSALKECRAADAFSPETLLCAGSTDPCEELQAMEMRTVEELNRAEIADRFAVAHGYDKYRLR